jgi:hypothetical protein
MSVALGVDLDPATNVGLSDQNMRQILAANFQLPGLIWKGGNPSGTSGLSYNVPAMVGAIRRSTAYGLVQAYAPAQSVQTTAGDGTYDRYDVIYLQANDTLAGDPDNLVHVGVEQGTPASTPTVPALQPNQIPMFVMKAPKGMTATSSSTWQTKLLWYAIPYGGRLSRIGYDKATQNYTVQEDNKWHPQLSADFFVPTDRRVHITYKAVSSVGTNANKADANANMGSYFLQFRLDGTIINDIHSPVIDAYCDEIMSFRYDQPAYAFYDVTVTPGQHTLATWVYGNKGWLTYPVNFVQGREISIEDWGVAN